MIIDDETYNSLCKNCKALVFKSITKRLVEISEEDENKIKELLEELE